MNHYIKEMLGEDNIPETPMFWDEDSFNELLSWAHKNSVSDVVIKPGDPVYVRLNGEWIPVSSRTSTKEEISMIADAITRSDSSSSTIINGLDIDFRHEVKTEIRSVKHRFRGNGTATKTKKGDGISLTLRTIPSTPPSIEDLKVSQDILDHAFPSRGLVIITGVMGSGKSTLLAALMRHIIETQRKHLITYESPIEFDLDSLPNKLSLVEQTEVPEQLSKGFVSAPRNSARRAADIILVGESRDPETIKSMLEASEIGVAAYSTAHTSSVAETPSRIINAFKHEEQAQIASTLVSSLSLIVQQRLVSRADGKGRIALQEFLGFTQSLKRELLLTPVNKWIPLIQEMVEKHGQSLLSDAKTKFEQGLILEDDYLSIKKETEF